MGWHNAHIIGDAASLFRLDLDIIAVRSVEFALGECHGDDMLWNGLLILDSTVDQLNAQIIWSYIIHAHPGANIKALAQTELPIASPINIEFEVLPILVHPCLPCGQHPCLLI